MSWKFIYILLLLHAPARLWIWLPGCTSHVVLRRETTKWSTAGFCTILALSFAMPWSLRFFFPAIFIFVDRMLLSTHQEMYLSLKHVKLLPRLSGWVRIWANSQREVPVLTLSLLAHTTEHCYQEEKQLCKPKCLKPLVVTPLRRNCHLRFKYRWAFGSMGRSGDVINLTFDIPQGFVYQAPDALPFQYSVPLALLVTWRSCYQLESRISMIFFVSVDTCMCR